MKRALEADRALCHACERVTRWSPVRGGRRLRCEGCGDVFPCRHACEHLDCAEARADRDDRPDNDCDARSEPCAA